MRSSRRCRPRRCRRRRRRDAHRTVAAICARASPRARKLPMRQGGGARDGGNLARAHERRLAHRAGN